MKPANHFPFLASALCALALLAPAPAMAGYSDDINIEFTRYTLDNGLTLVVHEDHKAPVVSVHVWYKVGSKDERPGRTGFAHLFEHLMFNGSENYQGEWFLPLRRAGATNLNGTTWLDRTNYYQTVPVPALDMVLWMESDRMGHFMGAITQENLDNQRNVVKNEKRQRENVPYGRSQELLQRRIFPVGHPYSWTTIGSMEDLSAASLDDVKEWFRTYYGAANAVVVIAGAVTPEHARQRVEHYFGDIAPGPALSRAARWIAKRDESSRDVMYDKVAQTRLTKVWNTTPAGDATSAHLDLASQILAGGKSSRLYRRLVDEDDLVTSVTASQADFEIAGIFEIEALLKPGATVARVEAIIDEEVQRLASRPPSSSEMERARTSFLAPWIKGLESVHTKAQILANSEVIQGHAGNYKKSLVYLDNASRNDVQQAVRGWLTSGDYVMEVHPQPPFQAGASHSDRSQMPDRGAVPELRFPEVKQFELSNGIPVYLVERDTLPAVNIGISFDAGFAADTAGMPGLASFTADMLNEGTAKYSAIEIAAEEERLGANINTGAGNDTHTVSLSALSANLNESLALYAEVVRRPSFPERELQIRRSARLSNISQIKTNPAGLAFRLAPKVMYGEGHPYGMPSGGTEDSLKAIKREHLQAFYNKWITPANARIVVVGDTDQAQITGLLERHFGSWRSSAAKPQKSLPVVANPAKSTIYLVDFPGSPQTALIGGTLTPDNDSIAIEESSLLGLGVDALGGNFTARINMNLREDKGWTYGARLAWPGRMGQRPLQYTTRVQVDKTAESIAEILKEAESYLGSRPITTEELDRSRNSQLRSRPAALQTGAGLVGIINSLLQRGLEPTQEQLDKTASIIRAATPNSVMATARKHIRKDKLHWIVVGDRQRIERPIRNLGIADLVIVEQVD